jgi:hypothetical protein
MAKLVIHAYTKDEQNTELKTVEKLVEDVKEVLGGYISWIDVVDFTNATTYKRDEEDIC